MQCAKQGCLAERKQGFVYCSVEHSPHGMLGFNYKGKQSPLGPSEPVIDEERKWRPCLGLGSDGCNKKVFGFKVNRICVKCSMINDNRLGLTVYRQPHAKKEL